LLEKYGLKQIRLNLPFRLDHVNCFLAEGENGWKIIDTGLHNQETIDRWEEELAGKEVTDIILTHYHPDHYGYAGALQKKTGAAVWMSETDEKNGKLSWEKETIEGLEQNYQQAGIPQDIARDMQANTMEFIPRVTPYPTVNYHLQESDTIVLGNQEYEIFFAPGHSDGMVVFFNKENNLLLSADQILPKITPNISYWFHGDPNPLKSYLESLDRLSELNAELVVPSHGTPFYGANDRIREIQQHHDDRLNVTLESVRKSGTVYEVCQQLFPKTLTVHETRFAIGETLAHLEYLRYKGECDREMSERGYIYYM
jgi:glyoxylase-like metal-dependent hydrolase (beta-lactamase superfamily II)